MDFWDLPHQYYGQTPKEAINGVYLQDYAFVRHGKKKESKTKIQNQCTCLIHELMIKGCSCNGI